MRCSAFRSTSVRERLERTAQGQGRFHCGECGKTTRNDGTPSGSDSLGCPLPRAWAGYWPRHRKRQELRQATWSAIRQRTPWPSPFDAQ